MVDFSRSTRFIRDEDITPKNLEDSFRILDRVIIELQIIDGQIKALANIVKENMDRIKALEDANAGGT